MSCIAARLAAPARPFLLAFGTFAALAAAPSALGAVEQVNRADGAAGAFPLEDSRTENVVITDGGRSAFYNFRAIRGPWATATGIYRRDVDTNKTTRIASGDARLTGVTSDAAGVSFVTAAKLDPADTNGRPDLYGYVAATGKTLLLSRYDGNGAAIGVTGNAFITRGGRYALFATAIGVGKRDLTTGKTVKVADGPLGGTDARGWWRADFVASADGSIFQSGDKLVTPTGSRTLAGLLAGTNSLSVAESGTLATWVAVDAEYKPRTVDPATGVVSTLNVVDPLAGAPYPASLGYLAADGKSALVITQLAAEPLQVPEKVIRRYTFATGAWESTGLGTKSDIVALTRDGKFALLSSGPRSLLAASAAGVSLPGTTELPSPHLYVKLSPACRNSGGFGAPTRTAEVAVVGGIGDAPKPSSVSVDVFTTGGTFIQRITDKADFLKTGTAAFKTVTTVTYPDGRKTTESWTQRAMASNDVCGQIEP